GETMNICQYLDNLTEIFTVNSMNVEQEPIDLREASVNTLGGIFLHDTTIYWGVGTVMYAYKRMKPTKLKYAYLRMVIYLRDATTLEIIHTADLEIDKTVFIKIEGVKK
ncbi:MAG: hypothetical protein ACPLVI_08525, partial [Thermoplasmata archaeon]